jgi:uncharacterized protein YegL
VARFDSKEKKKKRKKEKKKKRKRKRKRKRKKKHHICSLLENVRLRLFITTGQFLQFFFFLSSQIYFGSRNAQKGQEEGAEEGEP